ncbi:MAG TPA: GNAT family N-acetyltransferase [Vicinamibacterales bacterium]|nr:GNAT family N-acetyltransferase [Vicinamibacterales bacterium]
MITIRRAATAEEYAVARALFAEYQRAIGVDLCFQSFERELETLPEIYGPPGGALFLATRSTDGEAIGCAALRGLEPGTCEMKRLYVRSGARGHKLGRHLVEALLAEARRLGYARMRLDTLETMVEARALYASLGFREIQPYNEHAVEGTHFMELRL